VGWEGGRRVGNAEVKAPNQPKTDLWVGGENDSMKTLSSRRGDETK